MEDSKFNISVNLSEVNCGCCGGTYAINERYRAHKEEKGGYWNCHYCRDSWGYGESLFEVEKRKIEFFVVSNRYLSGKIIYPANFLKVGRP